MKQEDRYKELQMTKVLQFIEDNLTTPIPSLVLKGSPFESVSIHSLVNQIVGKNKAKKKLPSWFENKNIIYPPKVNLEQTSSEITANHKSKLIFGKRLIDLTGGFGVDDFYFSKRIQKLTYAELNKKLYEIANHNFKALSVKNIQCLNVDSIDYLKKTNFKYDWIYVDPSRRNKNQKVFLLKDSLPNLLEHQDLLKEKSKNLMIKTSPMYDIEMGYKELSGIKELHIISVKNEVKELVWVIDWRAANSRAMKLFNYSSLKKYRFEKAETDEIQTDLISLSKCDKYVYEFNSSIMKSGLYDHFASKYNLDKLEKNTNLYTTNSMITSFPGKIYRIENTDTIHFKKLKKDYKGKFVNIISKNVKISTESIRKKLNCNIGSDSDYLIFAKTIEGNRVLKATRV
ncbi:THUMP-like domain-containing protein [Psychroflexus sediminis]|uniref:Uncharacterized protein n=1 Tax=Psychroflexus sediminis TaxID=470826 RepID=A0A1G7YQF9_9FLAO|nr:SAM-dependent methyltransferase [Psychroflexus sediminis]SDG98555.1 hypothetical protein SAMN04488027_11378 [Psychroflexus sediminis]